MQKWLNLSCFPAFDIELDNPLLAEVDFIYSWGEDERTVSFEMNSSRRISIIKEPGELVCRGLSGGKKVLINNNEQMIIEPARPNQLFKLKCTSILANEVEVVQQEQK